MGEDTADGEVHSIYAVAKVIADARINDHDDVEAHEQQDFDVKEWRCECGKSWSRDEQEQVKAHIRAATPDAEEPTANAHE